MRGNRNKKRRATYRSYLLRAVISGQYLSPTSRPSRFYFTPGSRSIKREKKPAAIVYGVNFTSVFHTHARRSALMDFHLSPLPTHPALIIRGMRTSARGMPGYAGEFMTSTKTDASRCKTARVVRDDSRRSRRNRRRLDARGIISAIAPQLGVLQRRERDRRLRRREPRRIIVDQF